jgi:tetratricopeptide (TPR) repeat protein
MTVRPLLREALVLHREGRLADARSLYEQVLTIAPAQPDALHLLGLIEYQQGNSRQAVALIGEALKLDPANAAAHCNMASAQQALGDFAAAIAGFDQAIALDSRYADAYYNRGNLRKDLKSWPEAIADYEQALALNSDLVQAHNNRGAVLEQLGRLDEALGSYERAIAGKADFAEAHRNRGSVLHKLRRFDEALTSCERAIAIRPDYAQAYSDRGVILHELRRFAEALDSCDRALKIRPDDPDTYSNRGVVLQDLGEPAAALASFDRAIACSSNHAAAHFNKSLTCLLEGDLEQGWREHEWRWKTASGARDAARFAAKPWLGGESIAGKTILLHAERGLGDTLQFCRYAGLLAERGATVVLEVQEPLRALLSRLEGVAAVLARGEPLPSFDHHCPMLSLPMAFNTTLATIPARIPYVVSDPVKRRDWQERLGPAGRLRVGLVWSGGFRPHEPEQWSVNRRRNIPLNLFAALAHPEVDFLSLQKGCEAEAELALMRTQRRGMPAISDWSELLKDFSDTAALIAQLDLVISVDTSTAHLAGAMGKPVWLLNRFDTCWRWLRRRIDSPWYPTMRIFRQQRDGDWHGVLARVRSELDQWVAAAR